MNSKRKGKVGEREFAALLREHGFDGRRGVQFAGGADSPDVVSEALAWLHFEVKRTQALNLVSACAQAEGDCGGKPWVVAHRRNHAPWLITLRAEFFFALLREFESGTQEIRKDVTPEAPHPGPLPVGRGEGVEMEPPHVGCYGGAEGSRTQELRKEAMLGTPHPGPLPARASRGDGGEMVPPHVGCYGGCQGGEAIGISAGDVCPQSATVSTTRTEQTE